MAPRTRCGKTWAARLFLGGRSSNIYGEGDYIRGLLAETLGTDCLATLKERIVQFADTSSEQTTPDHEAFAFLCDLRGGSDYRTSQRRALVQKSLQEIAELSGDTEGYIAQFTAADLRRKSVAAEVATLKITDGQPEEALEILTNANTEFDPSAQDAWDSAYIPALLKLDRKTDEQTHRWACFETRLRGDHLRNFMKALPDCDDVSAEDSARQDV